VKVAETSFLFKAYDSYALEHFEVSVTEEVKAVRTLTTVTGLD